MFEKKIVFTGFRDKQTIEILDEIGASLDNSIGNSTFAVIVKDESSKTTGKAKKAQEKKITKLYFDRGSSRYHGRVKVFAETLRNNGMEF